MTDEKIATLLSCKKIVLNPNARFKTKDGSEQKSYNLTSEEGEKFILYIRQNTFEGLEDDFSCGLSWVQPNGDNFTLTRYNGSSHNHPNRLEKDSTGFNNHIHKATERYIKANLKADGFAAVTDRYTDLDGALVCVLQDCNIVGLEDKLQNAVQIPIKF